MSKELTPTQKKKKYKRLSRLCFGGEFVSTAAPFIGIGIANYQEYFVEYDGTKMSLACALAFCMMGLAIWLVSKKKVENSFIALIIGWATFMGILFLIGKVINDLAFIMLYGLIGLIGAYGLDIGSAKLNKKAEKIQKGIERAEEELTAEAYKEELKEKKVKIKIKK